MDKSETAEKIIKEHVAWSVGAGLVPVPLLDILAVSAIQLDMLRQLCRVYEIDYSEESGKAMLSAVAGSSLARVGASLVKAIPGIGTVLGGISMPVLSGATTYALGHAAIRHFDAGGDFFDIDFSKVKEMYEEFFRKGKDVALQLYKKQKAASSKKDILKALEQLVEMKEKGLLTEEEFQERKQKLLEEL